MLSAHWRLAGSASAALALMALQFAAIRWSPADTPVRILLPLTIGLVPLVLWPHRARFGVWVLFVGIAANMAAILANGGLMPIEQSTVEAAIGAERAAAYTPGEWIAGSKDVLVAPGEGNLVALGDSIIIGGGGAGIAASPGDIVIWSGLMLVAAEASLAWHAQRSAQRKQQTGLPARPAEGGAATP